MRASVKLCRETPGGEPSFRPPLGSVRWTYPTLRAGEGISAKTLSRNAKYRGFSGGLDDRPAERRRASRGLDGDGQYLALVTGERPDGASHFC